MAHELTTTTPASLAVYSPTASRLVEVFLSGKSGRTLRAYGLDLQDFATFLAVADTNAAAEALLSRGHGAANELALSWRSNLLGRGLTPATVNRRLAALRSLVKLARTLGMVPWSLELAGVKSAKYRETKGPGRVGCRAVLDLGAPGRAAVAAAAAARGKV